MNLHFDILSIMRNHHVKHVHIVINLAANASRLILQGILRYLSAHPGYRIHIVEPTGFGLVEILDVLRDNSTDGIITNEMEDPRLQQAFEKSNIPLVVIGSRQKCIPKRKANIAIVSLDELQLGKAGAQHLLTLGNFESLGFVRAREGYLNHLSDLRQEGFCRELARHGRKPFIHTDGTIPLEDWLARMPHPAAILATFDNRAIEVLDACEKAGLNVPRDVRVLGIDNNEILCTSASPRLSSIATNCENEGLQAMKILAHMISSRTVTLGRPKTTVSCSCEIITRDSTNVLPPGRELVRRAENFIRANAMHALTADDVVAHLHASRALVFLRFREFSRIPLQEMINCARIEHVKSRLKLSRQSLASIAQQCGFKNANYLKMLFKKKTGMTMREFRTHSLERLKADE